MKLQLTLLAILFFIGFCAMGQDHVVNLNEFKSSSLNLNNFDNQSNYPILPMGAHEFWLHDYNAFETTLGSDNTNLNFNYATISTNSFLKKYTPLRQPKYIGLGDYQKFGGTLGSISLGKKIDLNYGAFICAQYSFQFSSKQIVFGGNYLFNYSIIDKLQVSIWGQYVSEGNSNDPTFYESNFFQKSNVGAGIQYNTSNNSQLKVGMEYQYDRESRTWKPESGGKVSLQF